MSASSTVRKQAGHNEWIAPARKNFELECCGCGLVHELDFRLVKYMNGGNVIQFRARMNNHKTAATRRVRGLGEKTLAALQKKTR